MLEFKYDYIGRRVEKTYSTYDGEGEVWEQQWTERYVYDGWNVVLVLDDNNDTVRKYTWGLDLSGTIHGAGGIGGLLAVEETAEEGTPKYWFFYDANGNVSQILDATDPNYLTIVARYEYDPYGNTIVATGDYAAANPIRFSTKWFDTELAGAGVNGAVGTSGLGYWGYRYYSPRLGRWENRDPMAEEDALNLQTYVGNDPTGEVDLLGQCVTGSPWFGCSSQKDAGKTKTKSGLQPCLCWPKGWVCPFPTVGIQACAVTFQCVWVLPYVYCDPLTLQCIEKGGYGYWKAVGGAAAGLCVCP